MQRGWLYRMCLPGDGTQLAPCSLKRMFFPFDNLGMKRRGNAESCYLRCISATRLFPLTFSVQPSKSSTAYAFLSSSVCFLEWNLLVEKAVSSFDYFQLSEWLLFLLEAPPGNLHRNLYWSSLPLAHRAGPSSGLCYIQWWWQLWSRWYPEPGCYLSD